MTHILITALIKQALPNAYNDADLDHVHVDDTATKGVYRVSFTSASRGYVVVDAFIDTEKYNLPRFVEVGE